MEPVPVYRVRAAGADPSYVFGRPPRGSGACDADWVGWLPLVWADFLGPDSAFAGDSWLTAALDGRGRPRSVAAGDEVRAADAGGELEARRRRGLEAFTDRGGDPSAAGPLWRSRLGLAVAADIARGAARLCGAHEEVAVEFVLRDPPAPRGGSRPAPPLGPRALRRRDGVVRKWRRQQLRMHLLLEAAVRIGVFDPGAASGDYPPLGF